MNLNLQFVYRLREDVIVISDSEDDGDSRLDVVEMNHFDDSMNEDNSIEEQDISYEQVLH